MSYCDVGCFTIAHIPFLWIAPETCISDVYLSIWTHTQIAILISRTHVFLIAYGNNLYSKASNQERRKIPKEHQIFLWFCGLRGAVSFSLAVQVLSNEHIPADVRALIFGTTMMIVFITVVVMGGMTPFMMRQLGLDNGSHSSNEAQKPKGITSEASGPDVSKSSQIGNGKQRALDGTKESSSQAKQGGSHGHDQAKQNSPHGSMTTLQEYLPSSSDAVNTDTAEFMDTFNNGIMMRLYEWDKRLIRPFFSEDRKRVTRTGNTLYETTVTRVYPRNGNGDGDIYEIGNRNVASALDDMDSQDDDLDKMTVADAAEHFGLASTGMLPSARQKDGTRSRTESTQSLQRTSSMTASKKNIVELQPIPRNQSVEEGTPVLPRPPSVTGKLRMDAAIASPGKKATSSSTIASAAVESVEAFADLDGSSNGGKRSAQVSIGSFQLGGDDGDDMSDIDFSDTKGLRGDRK